VVVAIERTGAYHRPVQEAFRLAGFDTRLVHPFTSKQYRQPADPGNKTDDTDLPAIFRATSQGFGLSEPIWPDDYLTLHLSWTRSTACVQSADPAIVAKAKALAEGVDDVETLARKVMGFTSSNPGKPGVAFDALDARKALECGGSCTSRANLAAALLRASGVPARTVAHLPLWAPGLYEHWLVEYWHPGAGWVWLESTLGRFRPSTLSLVVLNVANPEDEDLAFDPIQLRQVMPGAPHFAVHTTSRELFPARGLKVPMNAAKVEVAIVGEPGEMVALFTEARGAYARLAEECRSGKVNSTRGEKLRAAMRTAKAADLTAALRGT
jgi:hypothetical protein